jgi:hypothetical protein
VFPELTSDVGADEAGGARDVDAHRQR